METRVAMLAAAEKPGVRVSDLCREMGVSRQTFYRLRRRFIEEGVVGLEPRSRRPRTSPGIIPAWLEDEIVRLRKELPLDNGAQTIAYHLGRQGFPVPSVRTVHRALVRRGLVESQPEKRPKSSYRSFEYPAPNACWQIDATEWSPEDGVSAWIMDLLDDHSRVSLAAVVGTGPTGTLAWEAFMAAAQHWGPPARVLSDNGSCFTAGDRGLSDFEENLHALGVETVTSSPYHPQTCGKIERFHQTLKQGLDDQPPAQTTEQLQEQCDAFRAFYNFERPHRSLHGATPGERFAASPPTHPGPPIPEPPRITITAATVNTSGVIAIGGRHRTSVGTQRAGDRLTVIRYGNQVAILDRTTLITRLTLDPTRDYQPSGEPRGGPRRRPR